MDQWVDTMQWPQRRRMLTESEMREHAKRPRKRPYIPLGVDMQGRRYPQQVSAYGVLGVLMFTVSAISVVALLVHLVAR